MEPKTTPASGSTRLKPSATDAGIVPVHPEELERAQRVVRLAREASGLATHLYFSSVENPDARAAFDLASAAEVQAEALLAAMRNL